MKSQNVKPHEQEPTEASIKDFINSSRKMTEDDVKNAPTLLVEEINGDLLNHQTIKINASGMINGRNANDGIVIFSLKNPLLNNDTRTNNTNTFKADFELNYNESGISYPFIFLIYYCRETKEYLIRAYSGQDSDNKILFIKLSGYHHILKQRELISAGNMIFQINITDDKNLEITNLSCKDNNGAIMKEVFKYNETTEVSIGRDSKCTIAFPKDKSFSRIQTTFLFDEKEKQWRVIDGSRSKSSTNGTWIFGTHSFPIKDQMIVGVLTSKLKFTLVKN